MNQVECNFSGVEIKRLERISDNRGWLTELFRVDQIDDKTVPVMSYISMTKPGVTRGPHEHKYQTDYICFLGNSEFEIYLWDNRPDSESFNQDYKFVASYDEIIRIKIPPGVVHAYKNIGDTDGLVFNAPDKLYAGIGYKEPVDEIRHEDKPESRFKIDN